MWPFLISQPHPVFGGTSACWLFSYFHNPANSDMDYRIFNVRAWCFVCVRLHTGARPTASESARPCWLVHSLTSLYCAPAGIRTLDLWYITLTEMGVVDDIDTRCHFWNNERDSIENIFLKCNCIIRFWNKLETLSRDKCETDVNVHVTKKTCIVWSG